jgi:S-adenosylmethionine synthetase
MRPIFFFLFSVLILEYDIQRMIFHRMTGFFMSHFLFTSESVSVGHPDKVADQISDAILDACLKEDPESKVACETLVTSGLVIIAGEITTKASPNYQEIARETIRNIGYDDSSIGFDYRSCGVLLSINKQSPDIAQGINEGEGLYKEQGAGDQGLMFGYACDETPELMPLPIMLAHLIMRELRILRITNKLPYLRPDAKAQVTIEYDKNHKPVRLHTVVISTQHSPDVDYETISKDMKLLVQRLAPKGFLDQNTLFYINPTGRFVVGGPAGDCGLTGRKIIVDTYGGMGRHGGGAFSGKDPSKVDRSACYAARYVAKNIVAAGLAQRCEVQVSYAIGVPFPISIKVDTFGTGSVSEELLSHIIPLVFQLSPKGIIEMLNLARPIYSKTAFGGHFGRDEKEFTWEKVDRTEALLDAVKQESFILQK